MSGAKVIKVKAPLTGAELCRLQEKQEADIVPRRVNERVWAMSERIHVPCKLRTKNKYRKAAREYGMSQAEFGLAIVEQLLERRKLLKELVESHRRTKDKK